MARPATVSSMTGAKAGGEETDLVLQCLADIFLSPAALAELPLTAWHSLDAHMDDAAFEAAWQEMVRPAFARHDLATVPRDAGGVDLAWLREQRVGRQKESWLRRFRPSRRPRDRAELSFFAVCGCREVLRRVPLEHRGAAARVLHDMVEVLSGEAGQATAVGDEGFDPDILAVFAGATVRAFSPLLNADERDEAIERLETATRVLTVQREEQI